jgi:hypothetical protein
MNRSTVSQRTALLLSAVLGLASFAPSAFARTDATVEVYELRRDVYALQLFQDLNLTPQQRTALAPAINKAVATQQKLEGLKAEAAEREAKALKDALESFEKSGKLPPDVEKDLNATSSPAVKAAENELRTQLNQIVARLTPAQQLVLSTYETEARGKTDATANKAFALRQLDRVRVLPDLKFDARLARLEASAGAPDASPQLAQQVAEVKQLAYEVRSVPATEWREEREKLAAETDPQVLKLLQRLAEDDTAKGSGKSTKEQRQLEKSSQLLATQAFADAVNTRR